MKLTLDIKRACPCFWLSCVRSTRTDRHGARCLVGDRVHEVYEQTRYKTGHVELNLPDNPRIKAYYLCGEKPHDEGTHIAFVPCKNQSVLIDNRPLAKLSKAVKVADTSNQGKTECKALSAVTVTLGEDTKPLSLNKGLCKWQ